MLGNRDALILLVVYALAGAYSMTAYSWMSSADRTSERAIPDSERIGLSIVVGVLLLAAGNHVLSAVIGSRATRAVVLLVPIVSVAIVAARVRWLHLRTELGSALGHAGVPAAVCALLLLGAMHKLFTWESLSTGGIFYPDLPWHVGRVAEQAFQSVPGFWPLSPVAFPDALPYQSFAADSLVSATFRYLPIQLHAFNYSQVLFGWAMVLWTAAVLVSGAGIVAPLIVLTTTMIAVPALAVGPTRLGSVLFVFFHANPNSVVAWPMGLAFVFHLHQSFRRRGAPLPLVLVLLPPASLFVKANLALSFVFLQAVGFVVYATSKRWSGVWRCALSAAAAWMIALALVVATGRWPVSTRIQPSSANLWAYAHVAIPPLGPGRPYLWLFTIGLSALLVVAGASFVSNRRRSRELWGPVGVLAAAMVYVLIGWWLVVPNGLAEGEPMHVNFELIEWLVGVPVATSICALYDATQRRVVGASMSAAALVCWAVAAWHLDTQPVDRGGLAIHSDHNLATEARLRDELRARIPDGNCFAYNRRYVIYTDAEGDFPPDFAIAASGCPVLNGTRWRGYLGTNDAETLRQRTTIAVPAGAPFQVVEVNIWADPPARPTNFTARVEGRTVRVAWTAVPGATSYLIKVRLSPDLPDVQTLTSDNGASELTVPNVTPGVYFARVRARNARGVSAASEEIRVVVQ